MSAPLIKELYFSDAPAGKLSDRHKHNVYQMIFVTKGTLACEIAGSELVCSAPSLLFIGNYEPHIISAREECYERYVLTLDPYRFGECISPDMLGTVFSYHPIGFSHVMNIGEAKEEICGMLEALLREHERAENEKIPEGEGILLSALLYRLWQISPSHFAQKRFGAVDLVVSAVRMELECDFALRLDLDDLAARHHVSRYYLSHAFKSVTGYSLKEYLTLCRISYACQQLADPERPIHEIAEASGFKDFSNFSRAFKELIGMTPSEFRRKTV